MVFISKDSVGAWRLMTYIPEIKHLEILGAILGLYEEALRETDLVLARRVMALLIDSIKSYSLTLLVLGS